MRILAIETSCDETSAAIVEKTGEKGMHVFSNSVASSLALHGQTGGIIPEIAAREQVKCMLPVLKDALGDLLEKDIDAIAVTYGPGLIGSLLVGVETAKTLAFLWNKPCIPVNHLYGHIYANWLSEKAPAPEDFPAMALIVSGNHTDLVYMEDERSLKWLGGTRDDAAGECFDKSGRLLGIPYPAGATIEKFAQQGTPKKFIFPRARLDTPYDFSFSGLKTAVRNEVERLSKQTGDAGGRAPDDAQPMTMQRASAGKEPAAGPVFLSDQIKYDLCFAVQDAIFDMIIATTTRAIQDHSVKSLIIGGGVSANQTLANKFKQKTDELGIALFVPERKYSTDNAAMIGAAALVHPNQQDWRTIAANPELYFD